MATAARSPVSSALASRTEKRALATERGGGGGGPAATPSSLPGPPARPPAVPVYDYATAMSDPQIPAAAVPDARTVRRARIDAARAELSAGAERGAGGPPARRH